MAAAPSRPNQAEEDRFTCPICLDIFDKPVIITCGHTFCNGCLAEYKDIAAPQCPMCRTTFHPTVRERNQTMEKLIATQKGICEGCNKKMTLSKLRSHSANCAKLRAASTVTFKPVMETSQPVPSDVPNRSTFKCPYCGLKNLDTAGLRKHTNDEHANNRTQVVCPICASMPWGDPNQKSANFISHLNMRHQFEYDTYVDFKQDDDEMLQLALQASVHQSGCETSGNATQ